MYIYIVNAEHLLKSENSLQSTVQNSPPPTLSAFFTPYFFFLKAFHGAVQ